MAKKTRYVSIGKVEQRKGDGWKEVVKSKEPLRQIKPNGQVDSILMEKPL